MSNKWKFRIADIGMFLFSFITLDVYDSFIDLFMPYYRFEWKQADFNMCYAFSTVLVVVYLVVLCLYLKKFKKIGLGCIYGAIGEVLILLILYRDASLEDLLGTQKGYAGKIVNFRLDVLPEIYLLIGVFYFIVWKIKKERAD